MQSIRQPTWRDLLTLLLGYVVLDWASYFHSLHELNITPWNPAPALGLLFLLRFGKNAIVPLALAIFLADAWVRNLPVSLLVSFGLSALLTLGYWAIAEVLRHRLSSRSIFTDRQGLLEWAGIVTLGTPYGGSALARIGFGANGRQMVPGNNWLTRLAEAALRVETTTIFSPHDNYVMPQMNLLLPGAKRCALDGLGHLAMLYSPRVVVALLDALDGVGDNQSQNSRHDAASETP